LRNSNVDGRIILEWMLIWCVAVEWINLGQDRVQWRICCEHGNVSAGSIKYGGFIGKLSSYQSIRDSAPWSSSVSTASLKSTKHIRIHLHTNPYLD
jgi:hypothetical protein